MADTVNQYETIRITSTTRLSKFLDYVEYKEGIDLSSWSKPTYIDFTTSMNGTGFRTADGGLIFLDYAQGYSNSASSNVTVSKVTSGLHSYSVLYDEGSTTSGVISCLDSDDTSLKNRFIIYYPIEFGASSATGTGSTYKWANSSSSKMYTTTYSTSYNIGTGASNTTLLMNAANSSGELTTSGTVWNQLKTFRTNMNDESWYIPSYYELLLLYYVGKDNSSLGVTTRSRYFWSSSQGSGINGNAYFVRLSDGLTNYGSKDLTYCVVACRSF